MRPVRLITALILGLSLLVASQASAVAKSCNLVKDPKGDADVRVEETLPGAGTQTVATGQGNDPALDIITADIVSDAKRITAVVRVPKVSKTSAIYPYGATWRVNFSADGADLAIYAISDRDGVVGSYSFTDTTGGHILGSDGKVVFDTKKSEIRITVPLAGFAAEATIKKGTAITEMSAMTGAILQVPGVGNLRFPTVDTTAVSSAKYTAGAGSCVTVNK